ncbi:MAG: hypothetical protein JWP37_3507 [Mucilaginibacter sp.]|nr:hypothetical protein [Mucilaginibacter sp.]
MKRIITCSDGTWNDPEEKDEGQLAPTNVYIISNLLANRDAAANTQVIHYHSGVGTTGGVLQKLNGGITGAGLDADIIDAYTFIVRNYEVGDLNYLFGFSRGAYTARSLAGFIVNCGILKLENISKINDAYALYRDRDPNSAPWTAQAQAFRNTYSYPPAVQFIGVWDTVGALGIPLEIFESIDADKYKFHDTQLSSQVPFAYHALAADEHRQIFDATLWQHNDTAAADNQTIEQVWFAGAHRNVGGGYKDTGLSDYTLQWMVDKAKGTGLCFNETPDTYNTDVVDGALINSDTLPWKILEHFEPFSRSISVDDQQSVSPTIYQRIDGNSEYIPNIHLPPNPNVSPPV